MRNRTVVQSPRFKAADVFTVNIVVYINMHPMATNNYLNESLLEMLEMGKLNMELGTSSQANKGCKHMCTWMC